MKKKNAKTVSLLLNITMVFVTVFAIISSTYSWFNRSNVADVTSINMTTAGSSGILLSGNGSDWSSALASDGGILSVDIDESLLINSISTSGTVTDGVLEFYEGDFDNNVFSTTIVTGETLFYVFDMYILNNDTNIKQLTLGLNSSVVDGNGKDIELSTRVAFLNLGNASDSASAIALDGTGISSLDYIWEPNSTTRNNNIDLYHSNYILEGKMPYEGVNMETSGLTLSDNLVVDSVGSPEFEVLDVTTYDPIYSGEDGDITVIMNEAITKMRVYIWCEGQDVDCTNDISGGTAVMNFNFNTYNVTFDDPNYVPIEKFEAPTIVNSAGANYTWSATTTNIHIPVDTYSTEYQFLISKYVDAELTPIRTILSSSTALDVDDLDDLGLGEYYVKLKVHSEFYSDSDYSNTITFDVLIPPEDYLLTTSTISWTDLTNAQSYTVQAIDESTETIYTVTTTSLSLDLSAAMFDGSVYLPSGKQYIVSVKANGDIGYANSEYTSTLNWLYS
jgi:hypothetical protein